MNKFCSNCGSEITENAIICVKCGVPTDKFNYVKPKRPGRGLSIASMVLGIISIFYGSAFAIGPIIMFTTGDFYIGNYIEKLIFAIIYHFWPLAISITGLSLGIASRFKIKNGMNMTGIILNSITIMLCVISIIIM